MKTNWYLLLLCVLVACNRGQIEDISKESLMQEEIKILSFITNDTCFVDYMAQTITLDIKCNSHYYVSFLGNTTEWLKQITNFESSILETNRNKKIHLSVLENEEKEQRQVKVVIDNDAYNLSDTLLLIQKAGWDSYNDGEIKKLQQTTRGKVNLVVMGDGFTKSDLPIGGRYESLMKEANEHFFSIEPYKSYRDYFNVYMVVAESEEEGVGEKGYLNTVRNKFGTAFGSGTEITCNDELVFEYAQKVEELPDDKPLTVIVVLNSTKYAGTAYLYDNGNSIALCPMSTEEPPNDFEGVVHHEAGGHGFGFLCDEYVYYEKEMPESRKKDIQAWQKYGFQMNLDFTDDVSNILWKDFIGLEKYQEVGAYEGGYEYRYSVWRCEENSCMNNNIPYYNVQSRWSIVKRIMELSEKEFSIQDFIKADNVVVPEIDSRSVNVFSFKPLGEPRWIKTK